jgi:hypothetical protein
MGSMKDLLGDEPFVPLERAFDGKTYEPERDFERLAGQLQKVRVFMSDHQWHTLKQIQSVCGGTEAAVSARLRDLRKEKYGSHNVERRHVDKGLFEYRVTLG